MVTWPKTILNPLCVWGLRPCAQTHVKKPHATFTRWVRCSTNCNKFSVYLTIRSQNFFNDFLYFYVLSVISGTPSSCHYLLTNLFVLRYETKQIFSCFVVRVCCLSSPVNSPSQHVLWNVLFTLWKKTDILHVLLCEVIFYNLSYHPLKISLKKCRCRFHYCSD